MKEELGFDLRVGKHQGQAPLYQPQYGYHGGLVYVIGPDEDGPVKIGHTSNLCKRMTSLQPGCWLPLKIFAIRFGLERRNVSYGMSDRKRMLAGAKMLERATHAKLDDFELRLKNEWFDLSVSDAVAVMAKISEGGQVCSLDLQDIAALGDGADAAISKYQRKLMAEFLKVSEIANELNAAQQGA